MRLTNLPQICNFQFNITAGGTPEKITAKIRATTLAFNNNSAAGGADTITDSGTNFLIAGIRSGDSITVSGATNTGNNATFVVATAVAGTLTLTKSGVLTTEAAGATVKIVAPKSIPEGVEMTIKAKYANVGTSRVADSSESAASSSSAFTLRNNESISVQVNSTDKIWVDGTTNEGFEIIFSRNKNQNES